VTEVIIGVSTLVSAVLFNAVVFVVIAGTVVFILGYIACGIVVVLDGLVSKVSPYPVPKLPEKRWKPPTSTN
jgi:hypothetical protein